jgi:hypothetical protein
MQVSDRQFIELREVLGAQDGEHLRRAARKIAWARMSRSIDAANPFVESDPNRFASEGRATRE